MDQCASKRRMRAPQNIGAMILPVLINPAAFRTDHEPRGRLLSVVLALIAAMGVLCGLQPARADGPTDLFRIRIENKRAGEISVSADNGHTYSVVGHVTTPATLLVPGFSATEWAQDGTVCATAVHGLRICTRHNSSGRGDLICVVPKEYRDLPDSFGGQQSGRSGIYTDIPAASSIFRNLAPLVGSPVFLEHNDVLDNLPKDYVPRVGDVLVIQVQYPARMPSEIDIPNQTGGVIEEVFPDGERVPIARVEQPVYGIGRYDATSFTGVGLINTNHPGVITISTVQDSGVDISDEEKGFERRGGFQIIPNIHAKDYHTPPPSMMIVEPLPGDPGLEGRPPLFSGVLGLARVVGDPRHSYCSDIKIDHGPWEPMPELTGLDPLLFTAVPLTDYFADRGIHRVITEGITDFRILIPHLDEAFAVAQLQHAVQSIARSNIDLSQPDEVDAVVRGQIHVQVNFPSYDPRVKYLAFFVDGQARGYSSASIRPYEFTWDTRIEDNGRHSIAIRAISAEGAVITESSSKVIVANLREQALAPPPGAQPNQAGPDEEQSLAQDPGDTEGP